MRLIGTWIRNAFQNYPDRRRFYRFSFNFDKRKCTRNKKFVHIICYTVYDLDYGKNQKINRNTHQRCSIEIGVLKNFKEFTGSTCARISFLIKTFNFIIKETLAQMFSCEFWEIFKNTFLRTVLRPTTVLNMRLQHRCFLVNFMNFFLQNTSGWLPLQIQIKQIKVCKIFNYDLYWLTLLSKL